MYLSLHEARTKLILNALNSLCYSDHFILRTIGKGKPKSGLYSMQLTF